MTVNPASPAGGLSPEQATANIRKIEENQLAIAKSVAARGKVLEKAKNKIKEYAALQKQLEETESQGKREKLIRKMKESGARLDGYEKEYFSLEAKEKKLAKDIEQVSRANRISQASGNY